VLSFAWGLAVFHVVQKVIYAWNDKTLDPAILQRTKNLLGVFVVGSLYMVATYHFTNMYFAHQQGLRTVHPARRWRLSDPVLVGLYRARQPAALLLIFVRLFPVTRAPWLRPLLVVLGGFALLYVFIIGGQAYPLNIFPATK